MAVYYKVHLVMFFAACLEGMCTRVVGEDKQDHQVRLGVENGSCFVYVYIYIVS